MASISKFLGSFRQSSWESQLAHKTYTGLYHGDTFIEIMENYSQYRSLMRVTAQYEIRLIHQMPHLHWYLLIKMKDSDIPHLSLEITTSNLKDLIPTSKEVTPALIAKSTDVGIYDGALNEFCQHADNVVKEMDQYDLLTNNCQTFCNKLLQKIGQTTYPPTYNPEMGKEVFDCLNTIVYEAVKEFESTTSADGSLSAPDLQALYYFLIPLSKKWREIGTDLNLQEVQLDSIESCNPGMQTYCLREMLREYLKAHPYPPWEDLATAVEQHSAVCARSIRQRGELTNSHATDLECKQNFLV